MVIMNKNAKKKRKSYAICTSFGYLHKIYSCILAQIDKSKNYRTSKYSSFLPCVIFAKKTDRRRKCAAYGLE